MRWLTSWCKSRRGGSSCPRAETVRRPRGHPGRFHPRLEGLENRCLPSTVTNLADTGPGSLREAIAITDPGGSVDFEPGLAGTIALTTGTLTITKDLTITGPGFAMITVSGGHASTVFSIDPTFRVAIAGLTVAEGSGASGGGIHNSGTLTLTDSVIRDNTAIASTGTGSGGGISNDGTLTVTDSILSDNTVTTAADSPSTGGSIANRGTLTLIHSIVSGNVAVGSNAGNGQGAGIWNAGTLTVTDTIVRDNATTRFGGPGGGIWNAGTLTVVGSTLRGNVAFGFNADGGGIWNDGTLTVTGSTLSGNDGSERGGGIENDAGGTLTLIASSLRDNTARVDGGGISNETGCVLIIRNSTLSGNVASSGASGGGIGNRGGILTMIDSSLSDNTASNSGGGIWNLGGAGTITRSTLSGNVAFGGAGIWNLGELTVTNSTLSGNVASGGGGIINRLLLTVTSSTLSGNVANSGGGVLAASTSATTFALDTIIAGNVAGSSPDVQGRLDSQGHNLIGDGSGGTGFTDSDLVGTAEQPIDPQLEPLGDYCGPTQTMRPLPTSPAVDAGDNRVPFGTDQRGLPRIVNFVIDIGAVELQPGERGRAPRSAALPIASELPAWEPRADSRCGAPGTDALAMRSGLRSPGVATTDAAPAHVQPVASHNSAGHARPELPERQRVFDRLIADWDVGFFAGQAGTS